MIVAIRLDKLNDDDSDKLKNFLENYEDIKYVVYYEISDKVKKPHYQGYIECDSDKYSDIKEPFLELFRPTHTRYQRSFTPARKVEDYMIYVSKDKNLQFQKGYTEEYIKDQESKSYKKTKKEKKEGHRKEQYARFIKYCLEDDKCESGKYLLRWIASKLFDFLGYEPKPELANWLKGMVISAQTKLIYKDIRKDPILETSTKQQWIDRILF